MYLFAWLDESFSLRLVVTLLHFVWQGAAAGLIVVAARRLLKRAAAQVRYSLNVAAMLLMVACLPVTFVFVDVRHDVGAASQLTMAGSEKSDEMLAGGGSIRAFACPANLVASPRFTKDAKIEPDDRSRCTVRSEPVETTVSVLSRASAWMIWAAPYVTTMYVLGVVLMVLRFSAALWGGRKLRRDCTPVDDDTLLAMVQRQARRIGLKIVPAVALCERISIPVVVGVVKPMILLPAALASGLSPDQLQLLVTHELAHVRRYDLLVNLLQRLIEAVLFFHPVVWFVSRRVSIERENAADDLVLAAGWQPVHYADALVRMAELSSALRNSRIANQATALAASGTNASEFKRRVLRLLENTDTPKLRLTRGGILSMMLIATSLLVTPVIVQSWTNNAVGAGELTNKYKALQGKMNAGTKSPVMLTATIQVTNQRGEPVVGAVVRPLGLRTKQDPFSHFVWQSDQWGPAPLSRTDTEGLAHVAYPKYTSDTVETGQVTWLVDHGDYVVFLGDHAIDDRPAKVVLEDGVTIKVRAIDDRTNQPIDAPFALLSGNPIGDRWTLESDGTLVSRCVARERRSLRVMHLPRKQTEAVLFSDLIDLQEYRGNTLSLTVSLKPGVHVTGSLGREVPRPVVDGRVIGMVIDYPEGIADPSEYASRWEWQEATQVGEDGSFDLGWLPAADTLQILALCDGFVSRTPNAQDFASALGREEAMDVGGLPSGRGRDEDQGLSGAISAGAYDDDRVRPQVVLLEGRNADVNLRMEPTTACRVKLVGPDDRPVAGAKVMFSPNQAWHRGGSQVLGDGDSQSLLLRAKRLNQSEEKGSDQGEQLQDAGRRYEAISDANGVANVGNLPSHGSATFYVRHPTLQLPLSEENPSHRFVTVELASDQIAEVTVKLQRKEAPANADLSVLSAVPSETEIRNAIIGKWKLTSAERRGDRLQVDASDLQPYSLIEFDADHLSFGKVSAQATLERWTTLERWSYRLDLDSDPMRLKLSRPGMTRKAICWYVYGSDSPLVRQLSIVLPEEGGDFPEGFDTNGNDNLTLDYQRDETDPDWLEAEASRFRKFAVDFLHYGNAAQHELAREWEEWAEFYLREASLRRKAQATAATANELRVAGKLQQAKLVQRDADELRSQADAEHAQWEVSVQLRDLEKRRQDRIKLLTERSAVYRSEGRVAHACEAERELEQLLRCQNRLRANELKRRAAESRAKGDHRDADLYDREAERLLQALDQQDVAGGGTEGELLPAKTNEKEDAGAGGLRPASAPAGGDAAENDRADKFRVQGRVTDIAGKPMAGVEVRASTGYGTLSIGGHGTTDDNGRYAFQFLPGFAGNPAAKIVPQAATITAHKAGYFEANLNRHGNRLMAGVMPTKDNKSFAGVFLPGKTERVDFVMALAGQIEGLLVDHAGRPVPNRRLSLTGINLPPSSSVFQSTETDKNGRFHISDVPGSPYKWWFEMRISGEGRSRVQLRTEPLQVDGGTLITVLLEYAAESDAQPPSLECKGQRKEPLDGATGLLEGQRGIAPLKRKTFAVTGSFNSSQRSAVLKEIEQSGGKVGSSVDLKTDFLIAGEEASSSNLDSAQQFGVPIISLDDLRKMIRTTGMHKN